MPRKYFDYRFMKFTVGKRAMPNNSMKHLLAITIALLPSAALAQQFKPQQMLDVKTKSPETQQFTPQQMLDVMTKSPENRDVRVHDALLVINDG